MAIFSFAVLTLWLLCWVMWFFCLPGSKWFDNQIQYESWDFDGLPFAIITTVLATIAAALGFVYAYFPGIDIGIGIAAAAIAGGCLIAWLISFSVFALRDFHKRLRRLKDY